MNVRNYRVYIEDQEALEAFARRARRSSVLAIDTEFLREKTYYARLCLIQFATDDEVAVVDPFCIEDLHVLAPLLEDAGVMKVLHSGGQDLEILWHEVGVLPQPLFDTQVAAALLGHTQQIGYGALVGLRRSIPSPTGRVAPCRNPSCAMPPMTSSIFPACTSI